jgi:hypothetical protein
MTLKARRRKTKLASPESQLEPEIAADTPTQPRKRRQGTALVVPHIGIYDTFARYKREDGVNWGAVFLDDELRRKEAENFARWFREHYREARRMRQRACRRGVSEADANRLLDAAAVAAFMDWDGPPLLYGDYEDYLGVRDRVRLAAESNARVAFAELFRPRAAEASRG